MKYWHIVKQVICDLRGEACSDVFDYKMKITPNCHGCPWYEEYKKKSKKEDERG